MHTLLEVLSIFLWLCILPGRAVRTVIQASTSPEFGFQTTAKEVVDALAPRQALAGKVAVVTGGNSGMGLETVKALASAGCRVVLASRSVGRGQRAVQREIHQPGLGNYSVPDANVVVKQLDLGDLDSVTAFAEDLNATEPRVDFLVLNAGIMALPKLMRTADGFEKQIGVNHFGHALLTRLLIPKLKAQDFPSRIVVLSSHLHSLASLDLQDLHYRTREYEQWSAYGNSKLGNLLFAKALAKHLPNDGKIVPLSVHPGLIITKLWDASSETLASRLTRLLSRFKTIPQGAATTLWACLSPEAGNPALAGSYLEDCQVGNPSRPAEDEELAEKFWKVTHEQLDAALARRREPSWNATEMLKMETWKDHACCCKRGDCREATPERAMPVGDDGATPAVAHWNMTERGFEVNGAICCKLRFRRCDRFLGLVPYGYPKEMEKSYCQENTA
jgi:NAD(P)-dependent dehydrogenase (short-subunit alcohol dehydrogenase family)